MDLMVVAIFEMDIKRELVARAYALLPALVNHTQPAIKRSVNSPTWLM